MSKRKRNECGYTLVELLLVLAILGILMNIVASSLAGITGGATSKAAATELQIVQSAFDTLMVEVGAITVSENLTSGGVTVSPSTVIACYGQGGVVINVPTSDYYLRLRMSSNGKYTWDSEGLVSQASY